MSRWNTSITLLRASGVPTRVDGVTTQPTRTSSTVVAMDVQPLTPRQLASLPEGRQADDHRQIWLKSKLYPADDDNAAQPPDHVTIDGDTYEVWSVSDLSLGRSTRRAAHYHAIVRRLHPAGGEAAP